MQLQVGGWHRTVELSRGYSLWKGMCYLPRQLHSPCGLSITSKLPHPSRHISTLQPRSSLAPYSACHQSHAPHNLTFMLPKSCAYIWCAYTIPTAPKEDSASRSGLESLDSLPIDLKTCIMSMVPYSLEGFDQCLCLMQVLCTRSQTCTEGEPAPKGRGTSGG